MPKVIQLLYDGAKNCSVILKPELLTAKSLINLRMLYLFYIVLKILPQMSMTSVYKSLVTVQTILQSDLKVSDVLPKINNHWAMNKCF